MLHCTQCYHGNLPTIAYMTFQERLKELRKEDGITQKTLAEAIGTTCDCIGFWEHGRSEPSITEIIALAKYFGVTTGYLLGIADSY